MNPLWDFEWTTELAFLLGSKGRIGLIHQATDCPLHRLQLGGIGVDFVRLKTWKSHATPETPWKAVYVHLSGPKPTPPEFMARRLSDWTDGPVVIRIVAGEENSREAWDEHFIKQGWRRHPLVLQQTDFTSLENEATTCLLAYLPQSAEEQEKYPAAFLAHERNLHMDMLREGGRRADAHLARYTWALGFVRPNDFVIDAACGLGYGTAILRAGSRCGRIIGIDNSRLATTYARDVYGKLMPGMQFLRRDVTDLAMIGSDSVDCVVSFETLEHLKDPAIFMAEVLRILKPGGRFVGSVPNLWIDETGKDPSPYHLQTFDLPSLLHLCRTLRLDHVVGQCAGGTDPRFGPHRRLEIFSRPPANDDPRARGVEWWLLAAIKDPLRSAVPYVETVFPALQRPNSASPGYHNGYSNPWLVHSLVHTPFRLKSPDSLSNLARAVESEYQSGTPEHGAALAVLAHQTLGTQPFKPDDAESLAARIGNHLQQPAVSRHQHRWCISLRFVLGRLLLALDRSGEARIEFQNCADLEFDSFAPHIATKTTEAAFLAGKLAFLAGDHPAATRAWRRGTEIGAALSRVELAALLIDPRRPHVFGIGDGMREIVLAYDNVIRCANGLHLLREYRSRGVGRLSDLERSWQQAESHNNHFVDTIQQQQRFISELQGQLSQVKHFLHDLENKHQQLSATCQQQADYIPILESARNAQTEAEARTQTEISRHLASLAAQENFIGQLQIQVAERQNDVESLRVQLGQVADTSVRQADYIASLEKDLGTLQSEIRRHQASAKHQGDILEEQQNYISQLRAQGDAMQHELNALHARYEQLATTSRDQAAYIATLEKLRDDAAAAAATAMVESKRHLASLTEQQTFITQLHKQEDALQLELSSLRTLNEQLTTTSRDQTTYITTMEKFRNDAATAAASATAESKRHLASLTEQQDFISQLRAQGDGLQHELTSLRTRLEQLTTTSREQAAYIATLENLRDEVATVAATATVENHRHLASLAEQQTYITQLSAQTAARQAEVDDLRNQLQSLGTTAREQTDFITVLQSESERLTKEAAHACAEVERLGRVAQEQHQFIETLQRQQGRAASS